MVAAAASGRGCGPATSRGALGRSGELSVAGPRSTIVARIAGRVAPAVRRASVTPALAGREEPE
jgi:hypothetical protein